MKYGGDLVAQQLCAKRIENEQICNLTSQVFAIQKTLIDLKEGTDCKYARVKESFSAMNHNLWKIVSQPVAVRSHKKRKTPLPSSTVDHAQVSPDSDVDSVDFSVLNQVKRRKNTVLFLLPGTLLHQNVDMVVSTSHTARGRYFGTL